MRRDISGENCIRLFSESPTNPQFYTSIFKTLGSLYQREWSRRTVLTRKHLLSSLCVRSVVLDTVEAQR